MGAVHKIGQITAQIATLQQNSRREIEIRKAGLDEQVALGQLSRLEEIQQLRAFTAQKQAEELATLNAMISLLDQGLTAHAEALRQRSKLEQDFGAEMARLRAQEVRLPDAVQPSNFGRRPQPGRTNPRRASDSGAAPTIVDVSP